MKKTISAFEFVDAFNSSDTYKDNFSYLGKLALYVYLTQLEDDMGEEIELDVVAFCCDYKEYDNLKEFQNDYGEEYDSLDKIEDNTTLIRLSDIDSSERGFIIQVF